VTGGVLLLEQAEVGVKIWKKMARGVNGGGAGAGGGQLMQEAHTSAGGSGSVLRSTGNSGDGCGEQGALPVYKQRVYRRRVESVGGSGGVEQVAPSKGEVQLGL
jgi:hypothetical protein